jgi:hypothetical protein
VYDHLPRRSIDRCNLFHDGLDRNPGAVYAALLFSLFALVESHLPLPTLLLPWSPVGSDVPILHLTTALVAAYFGYYWTDAVVEADRRGATKTA